MELAIINKREEFLLLEEAWRNIQADNGDSNFYRSFDWFYSLLFLSKHPPEELFIIAAKAGGETVAILPFCIKKRKFRLFALRSLEIIGNIYSPERLCVVRKGFEEQAAEAVVEYMLKNVSETWDVIFLESISEREIFYHSLKSALSRRKAVYTVSEDFVNVITDFSQYDDSEKFFRSRSKNLQGVIKKNINKMNREGSFDIVLTTKNGQALEKAIADYYDIYDRSWKEKEYDPEFHGKLAQYISTKGFLRLFMLYFSPLEANEKPKEHQIVSYLDDLLLDSPAPDDTYIPIAAYFMVLFGKNVYFLKTAYREDFRRYSPGMVLFWFISKFFMTAEKVEIIDHQRGNEAWKLKWGEINEKRMKYRFANPRRVAALLEIANDKFIISPIKKMKILLIKFFSFKNV